MKIRVDDLTGPEIAALLTEHLDDMAAVSPPESRHALDLPGLRRPEITFWSVWDGHALLGCGALKELSPDQGEIKSMRTATQARRRGVGSMMLHHLVNEARRRAYTRLSLETGAMAFFHPAHRLYESFGFVRCGPFAGYRDDPNSVFYMKLLARDGL